MHKAHKDLKVKMTASSATHPATAPPATALPVTVRHATATQATRGVAVSAATRASPPWTATDCPGAPSSPRRMKKKMKRVLSSRCLRLQSCQRDRKKVEQEDRGGQGGGGR